MILSHTSRRHNLKFFVVLQRQEYARPPIMHMNRRKYQRKAVVFEGGCSGG
jgi:hypothetical protein